MKVLLINPEFPDTFWSFHDALWFEGKKAAFPPLGLLTVSSLLPESWERQLIDMEAGDTLSTSDIEKADMVLVTGMLVQKAAILRVVRQCKALGKRVVLGGPYVSTSHEDIPEADHIFIGEAESTLPEFVRDLDLGQAKPVYEAAERPQLSLTPLAHFGLIKPRRYSAMSIQYSRGCPFSCEFCDIIEIYGRVPRTKSNQQILAELEALYILGWRGTVFIVDDNFIGNKKNVRQLLPELAAWQEQHGFPFSLMTEASVNLADDEEVLADMRRAGFKQVFIGIETPVKASLAETRKTQNRGDLLDQIETIRSYGMEVMAGFIVGFDNDPIDVFERHMDFIEKSAIPLAMSGLLAALPDTRLWRRLKSEGRLRGESAGSNTIASFNFETKLPRQFLIDGYQSMMRTIYSPKEYYRRALTSLARTPLGIKTTSEYGLFHGIASFTRVVLKVGVKENGRKEFWLFLLETLRKHRDKFERAIKLAAMGHHFRKINESGL